MNLDYVYGLDHIVLPGETIFSSDRNIFVGGKGLNQSVALAKAGLNVWHAGIEGVGGEQLTAFLQENGIHTELMRKSTEIPCGHTIIQVDKNGQNCIILYGGTNRCITEEYIAEVLSHFDEGDLILLQNEVNLLDQIIDAAYEKGMTIALNPSPFDSAIDSCDLSKVSLFLVNEVEGGQISGESAQEPEKILDWFQSHYPNAAVVLTLGGAGSCLQAEGQRYHQDIFKVQAVDTTAAGDTFTGYFLEGWMNGRTMTESLRRAAKASSIAVSRQGAAPSIPTADELK